MANVLIIDDDPDVTRLLETHLAEEGHVVTVTHDGKEGMTQLLKTPPDLIMLDVFLPDVTGYQMCNRIRKNEPTRTTPIIMMTGAARFPNQQMYGRQRGANEYIFKPFNIVEVGDMVHKYIAPTAKAKQERFKGDNDNLAALSSFLRRTLDKENGADSGGVMNVTPQIPDPVEPLASFGHITLDKKPPAAAHGDRTPASLDTFISTPVANASEGFIPPTLTAQERFMEFGLDLFALATRLCSTHAEKHLADQLLRTSLGMGAKLHVAHFALSHEDFLIEAKGALHDLREAGYWLMLTRKAGLEKLGKPDLEKTCQSLTTLLTDFVKAHPGK